MTATGVVFLVVVLLLGLSGLGAVWRIISGPSILDRMIGSEILLVVVMASMLVEMVYHEHTRTLPVVLVLVTLGFTGSVSVSRYVSSQRTDR